MFADRMIQIKLISILNYALQEPLETCLMTSLSLPMMVTVCWVNTLVTAKVARGP